MPGGNFVITGWSTCRATPDVAFFVMLKNNDECNWNWRRKHSSHDD